MEMRSAAKHSAAQSSSEQLTAVHKRERAREREGEGEGERDAFTGAQEKYTPRTLTELTCKLWIPSQITQAVGTCKNMHHQINKGTKDANQRVRGEGRGE